MVKFRDHDSEVGMAQEVLRERIGVDYLTPRDVAFIAIDSGYFGRISLRSAQNRTSRELQEYSLRVDTGDDPSITDVKQVLGKAVEAKTVRLYHGMVVKAYLESRAREKGISPPRKDLVTLLKESKEKRLLD